MKHLKRIAELVHVYPDLREVCSDTAAGKREYFSRTRKMAARQDEICPMCKRFMTNPSFDHQCSRGGGKRDDRIEVDGQWQNAAMCYTCNSLKGSRRYHWINREYAPQEAA